MTLAKRVFALSGWRGRGLDVLIGGLAVLGHAPFHIWPITLIALAFLMNRLDAARAVRSSGFSRGFWFALGYFLFGTFWIGSAFIVRGPEFIPVMPPMILGLAALLSLFWGLAGWAYIRLSGKHPVRWLALAGLLMMAEFARGNLLSGFPWNLPGYIFKSGSPLSQIAAFIGVYGLSFLVFIMAACIAPVLSRSKSWGGLALCAGLIAGLWGFGAIRLSQAVITVDTSATIRIVQVPFSQKDKFDRAKSIGIVNDFIRMSAEPGIDDITHLIWPEGAVVGLALENTPLLEAMGNVLTANDITPPFWLLNSLRVETKPMPDSAPRDYYYNTSAIIAYDAQGYPALVGFNDKTRLVPFGEYFPGGRWVEELGSKTLSTSLASITPAPQKILSQFPGLPPVSPQICYEIIFPGLTPRPRSGPRAQWILNQSNDAWYGRSIGPAQHANIAAYRAIEEGMPVVRSASNGVSGLVDPYGRYSEKLGPQDLGVLDIQLPKALSRSHLPRQHVLLLFLIITAATAISILISKRDKQT